MTEKILNKFLQFVSARCLFLERSNGGKKEEFVWLVLWMPLLHFLTSLSALTFPRGSHEHVSLLCAASSAGEWSIKENRRGRLLAKRFPVGLCDMIKQCILVILVWIVCLFNHFVCLKSVFYFQCCQKSRTDIFINFSHKALTWYDICSVWIGIFP